MVYNNLEISPASPKEIRYWAERCLPTGEVVGEVTSWETVNYKTLKPEPNGLFCQKIFGPIVDYTCACGKKALKLNMGFCSKCGVERTTSQVRRYRMGYINLKQPVAHTLYASQKPSPLGFCLNWPNKKLQAVLYGTEFCHLSDPFQFFYNPQIRDSQPEKYIKIAKYSFQPQSSSKLNLVQRKKLPRFILKKNKMPLNLPVCKKIYSRVQLSFSSHLYGINYDMSWRQVEDFQDFLLYMWEQPWSTDRLIPYYFLTQTTENYTSQTIPNHVQYYPIQTGGFVFQAIFSYYNLIGLQRQLTLDLHEIKRTVIFLKDKTEKRTLSKIQKSKLQIEISRFKEVEKKILRRFIYFRDFHKGNIQPAWMILSYLPILPPGLRPITSIRGELIVSDLNSLYRKVLTRNRRLINSTQFNIFDTALSGSWASWCYNLRQVQESVDSLLKTGKVESGKNIKSLLDALKGKRGRFRQHLLGKRVDYSGRSVIVVGPQLKIYECGLPKQMAVELFQPFLIQQLRNRGIAFTTTGAKAIIMERKPIIWTLLREILQSHPILLNRAPTLHRLGIQAFIPKLVDGKAILLHPLVCPAFNADFDGDQMAVHVPLSPSARSEAFNLLLACNHLLAPASGQPLLLPTQDMILGCYYLTNSKEKTDYTVNNFFDPVFGKQTKNKGNWYLTIEEVLEEYQTNKLHLHTPVWIFWQGEVQNFNSEHYSQEKNTPIEFRLDIVGTLETIYSDKYQILGVNLTQSITGTKQTFIRTTPGRVIFYNLMNSALLK